jgi:serine/threonine protein kinase
VEVYQATEAFKLLKEMYSRAQDRIRLRQYGQPYNSSSTAHTTTVGSRSYKVTRHMAQGDLAQIYLAEYDAAGGNVELATVKIVTDKADNDLMETEQKVLKLVKHKSLSTLLDTFKTSDARFATIYRYIDGYDLIALRRMDIYRQGVPLRHVCWILERLLSVLGFLHLNGVIHGNIEPGNVLVRPGDHNAFLIDLTFALIKPTRQDRYRGATEYYSAPELFADRAPLPTSDIYSLGKTIVYLLGGDVETNQLPASVDVRFKSFLSEMLHNDP